MSHLQQKSAKNGPERYLIFEPNLWRFEPKLWDDMTDVPLVTKMFVGVFLKEAYAGTNSYWVVQNSEIVYFLENVQDGIKIFRILGH